MDIEPGEIFRVTIPPHHVVGSEQHSRRPFVVVSRILINRQSRLVVGVPLTTSNAAQEYRRPPHRIFIPAGEINRDIGFRGDIKDSVALTDQIRALDKNRLEQKMGKLSGTVFAAVGLGMAYLLDLR